MRVLVTGAAGHIGAQVMKKLMESGITVQGIDSYTDFYAVDMKQRRAEALGISNNLQEGDISDAKFLNNIFSKFRPTHVINLAARAGVRSTWNQFDLYNQSNILGFQTLLASSIQYNVEHFMFASSSSVYGEGLTPPYQENAHLHIPKSYYALTKVANEIAAQAASSQIKTTGIRFFTVYGPWGRPDMATLQFVAAGLLGRTAVLTGASGIKRDFTYVEDAAQVVVDLLDRQEGTSFEIINVAGGRPQSIADLLLNIKEFGLEIETQGGSLSELDVPLTHGSTAKLSKYVAKLPSTTLREGLGRVIDWAKTVPPEDLARWVIPPSVK